MLHLGYADEHDDRVDAVDGHAHEPLCLVFLDGLGLAIWAYLKESRTNGAGPRRKARVEKSGG